MKNVIEKAPKSGLVKLDPPRRIAVEVGDVFAAMGGLIVVAVERKELSWARPPIVAPKAGSAALRNSRTGRLVAIQIERLQLEYSRAGEQTAARAWRDLGALLGVKFEKTPRKRS